MPQTRSAWSDDRVEQLMGRLLRAGVMTAAAVVLAGGTIYLARHGSEHRELHQFRGEPASYREPVRIAREAAALSGRGLIQLGILLLIATPVARVAFSIWAFSRQRDHLYVLISAVVLAILVYSIGSGFFPD